MFFGLSFGIAFYMGYVWDVYEVGVAFAFILHAHSYIFFILVGTYYFSKDSKEILSFRKNNAVY